LRFAKEKALDIVPEIERLMIEHWRDIKADKAGAGPPDPDWDRYRVAEEAGLLHCFTARSHDGELVGYLGYYVVPAIHYRRVLQAEDAAFFIRKDHRKGMAGVKLFRFAEAELKRLGAQRVFAHVKPELDIGPVFERLLGYRLVEKRYCKNLKE
jgi:GNAT superfamily N-acetyltransferase